jgi:predicted kinase
MTATLHILVGKIASGKSTLAAELAQAPATVVLSEDEWLAALYGPEMRSIEDFVRNSRRLRGVMGPHILRLLHSGVSVVLDFQANTLPARAWMKGLVDDAGVAHLLHYLDVPDDICRARMHARNASGDHPFVPDDAQFDAITRYFAAPKPEEGFDIKTYKVNWD